MTFSAENLSVDRAPPGPIGELTALPPHPLAALRDGCRKEEESKRGVSKWAEFNAPPDTV